MRRPARPWVVIGTSVAAGVVVIGLASVVAAAHHVPLEALTYDSSSLTESPAYTGSVSILNIMLWGATAAMAAQAAWLVPEERGRMTVFAALTAVLGADDALRLHEGLGPSAGVPEALFYAAYAAAGLWLARSFWPRRAADPGWAYYLGAAFLACSILVDVVAGSVVLLEDGSKLLGTFVWLTLPVLALAAHRDPAGARAAGSRSDRARSAGPLP